MKACAVMQPYLFPYIGYYQLVYASDVFIVYDDVSFIKRSYINRNSIIVNNEVRRFCLPVFGGSSNILIKDLSFGSAKDLLKTIQRSYSRAPYFHDVFRLLSSVFNSEDRNVARLNELSISKVFSYLGIKKKILFASELEYDRTIDRADRLIHLSKMQGCHHYINSPGGKDLYRKDYFDNQGVNLSFIESKMKPYKQLCNEFFPYLSIIDILMNCSLGETIKMLSDYELL